MRLLLSTTLLLFSLFSLAQMNVKGRVYAQESEEDALPGVSVVVQDFLIGTVTREDGSFNIGPLEEGEYVLEFRMIGRETRYQKIVPGGESEFQIGMAIDEYQMDAFTVEAS